MTRKSFIDTIPPQQRTLALACGLLGEFDLPTLLALLAQSVPTAEIESSLQQWSWVQRLSESISWYRVDTAAAEACRSYLKNVEIDQQTLFLERAVTYFTILLGTQPERRIMNEVALMRHLEPLFFVLADDNKIDELIIFLTEVERVGLQKESHQQALAFYQAVVMREKHNYLGAESQLLALLRQTSLDQRLRALVQNALGWTYEYLCQFDRAFAAYEESVMLYHALGDHVSEGKVLKNHGIIRLDLGDYQQAARLFEQAYQLAQQSENTELEMRTHLELGFSKKQQGQWDTAKHHYQIGLAIAQQRGNLDMIARYKNNLGTIACFAGEWSTAEEYYQQALRIFLNPQQMDKFACADVYHSLGQLAMLQGQFSQAGEAYTLGLNLANEAQLRPLSCQFFYRLGQLSELQHDSHAAYPHYQDAIRETEEMLRQVSRESTQIQVAGIRQQIYQTMVLCCLKLGRHEEAFHYVQRAKGRAFLDLVARSSAQAVNIYEQPCTVADLQTVLPENTAIIEFFSTGETGLAEPYLDCLPAATAHLRNKLLPSKQLLIFVVTARTLNVVTLAASIEQITRHFDRFTKRLRGTEPDQVLSALSRWHQLDGQLLEPVRSYLHNVHHLIIAPHSVLHYLPFHALAKSGQILQPHLAAVSYIPSASLLLRVMEKPLINTTARAVLAVGVDGEGLRHAAAEAAWVAGYLQGDLLLNTNATVATVRHHLKNTRVIHFSCHGHFSSERPMHSGLELIDGQLSAEEILQLGPLQAELVVVSACETGLNHLMPGDELMGLTRALLGVGVRSLLMTLWKIEELPTRIFMEQFYQSWQMGSSRSVAVTSAQQLLQKLTIDQLRQRLAGYGLSTSLITKELDRFTKLRPGDYPFAHPYYWGAFILVGDAA